METNKTPFEINFPLEVLVNSSEIDFKNKKSRENIFKRNIYYFLYEGEKNHFLEERKAIYSGLAKEISKFIKEKYPPLNILNISVFGSSLFSKNPGDFDFLTITSGNIFLLDETHFTLRQNIKSVEYPVGISIKGIDNFTQGVFDINSNVSIGHQAPIIYRTASSLFRRHVPISGQDFINNENVFLKNIYAQVSDLLHNTYKLFYLGFHKKGLNKEQRARKILSRVYEAMSYIEILEKSTEIVNLRKEIYLSRGSGLSFLESKKLFNKVVSVYNNKVKQK